MEFLQRIWHALTQLHPLHPMFVHFPIALTGAASFFILLALILKSWELEQVAFANLALASIGTVAAGITGYMDNINNYTGTAPNASWKIFLATLLFLITAGTSLVRWKTPNLFQRPARVWYIAAILTSFAISLVLSFLGGVILYGF